MPDRASSLMHHRAHRTIYFFVGFMLLAGVLVGCRRGNDEPQVYEPRKRGTLTFSKHIAPIMFQNCSGCHRPGQSAPFPLLTIDDVRKHAEQIVTVTRSGYMPPWLPEPGHGDFVGARRLTAEQIGMLDQWAAEGLAPGNPKDLPRLPTWPKSWQLGTPDLIVTMTEPFSLPAEGPDLYRNFVIPIPLNARRYVKAVEFDPGNPAIVHHAFIRFDSTPQSRRYDAADPQPGFDGIHAPTSAQPPEGFFLSWQPGKTPTPTPKGFAWSLDARTDVVLQVHLQPSGKPETIQSRIAFYFTDKPPLASPLKVWLTSYRIDIPAGETNYVLEESYTLPADVDVLGILPHAHYLAKELRAFALLPDQTRTPLLWIKQWDFNWQGDYRYAKPIFLPKGSAIRMRYVYDNSTDNPANPHHPPRRVTYGLQSSDEMGELWLQVLPRRAADRAALQKDHQTRVIQDTFAFNQYLLGINPRDAHAHSGLGKANYFVGRLDQAISYFQQAILLDAKLDEPHYYLGLIRRRQGNLNEAVQAFTAAVNVNPDNARAHGNLGLIHLDLRNLAAAETHLRRAIQLEPRDVLALDSLGVVYMNQGNASAAAAQFRAALKVDPSNAIARQHLEALQTAGPR